MSKFLFTWHFGLNQSIPEMKPSKITRATFSLHTDQYGHKTPFITLHQITKIKYSIIDHSEFFGNWAKVPSYSSTFWNTYVFAQSSHPLWESISNTYISATSILSKSWSPWLKILLHQLISAESTKWNLQQLCLGLLLEFMPDNLQTSSVGWILKCETWSLLTWIPHSSKV